MKNNTKKITYIAIFSTLISILSIISIPTPWGVPFTLQTFAIAFAGFSLGKKYGTYSILIYLLLGGMGLPVFAGLKGGFTSFISITGGFLFGFIFLAFFAGFKNIFFSIIGLFICHLLGVVQFSLLTKTPFLNSILIVSLPYVIKDLISLVLAYYISKKFLNITSKQL